MSTKGVILIGGPSKGTRFRPLSLDKPKPLFELAGKVSFPSSPSHLSLSLLRSLHTHLPSFALTLLRFCFPGVFQAMIWHQISALAKVKGLKEIILLGVYEDGVLAEFLRESRREFPEVQIK